MEIAQIIPHVEALIFASDHPLSEIEIIDLLNNSQGFLEDLANMEQVQAAIEAIHEKYQSEFYSFELKRSGGGFQFLTKPAYYPTVAQLNGDKYLKKLSVAALETLSIIAYKQPITKSEIEAIRGVNSDYSIQKLLEKELIIISGRKEEAVGKPLIYATSKSFMDYFGLNSPEDLPRIKEVLQEELSHPTLINPPAEDSADDENMEDEDGHLAVSETGELLLRERPSDEATAQTHEEEPKDNDTAEPSDIAGEDEPEENSGTEVDEEETEENHDEGDEENDDKKNEEDEDSYEDEDDLDSENERDGNNEADENEDEDEGGNDEDEEEEENYNDDGDDEEENYDDDDDDDEDNSEEENTTKS